jgi:hypothetical protein
LQYFPAILFWHHYIQDDQFQVKLPGSFDGFISSVSIQDTVAASC